MRKFIRLVAPLAILSFAACSSPTKKVTLQPDAAGSGSGSGSGGPDAAVMCGFQDPLPPTTVPAATTFWKSEKLFFKNATPAGTDDTKAADFVGFNNSGDPATGDQIQLTVFENAIGSGVPAPGTYTIGDLMHGGTPESDPFSDNTDPNGAKMLVLGFDLAATDMSLYLGYAGTITITLDTTSLYKATATGVMLAHFDSSGMASADGCTAAVGDITVNAAPTKRTMFDGRDNADLADRRAAVIERIRNGGFQLPSQLRQ